MSLVTSAGLNCVAFAAALQRKPNGICAPFCTSRRNIAVSRAGSGFKGRRLRRGNIPVNQASSGKSVEVKSERQIELVEEILSGEWPENVSILNFEDLSAYFEPNLFKAEAQPSSLLAEVMTSQVYVAYPDQLLEDIDHHFANISGIPVIDEQKKCIGVLSKKDTAKASNGLKSKVGEVMSSPIITLSADKTVLDAAILMLKNKIHRIPVVNEAEHVVGIVTRTDIFNALEGFST
uniref:TSA: Wollemia nobilis Ref_Wollemi_Transcript_22064_1064 transcribed RNA sequence n=1 Tax=Wollemia nobilis TaxID=56998 RepID=A0A0C9QMK4_9CONI